MRDPARIDRMLSKLKVLWQDQPDLRLGQLVYTLAYKAESNADVFYVEDAFIEEVMDADAQNGWVDWKSLVDAAPYRSMKCPVGYDTLVDVVLQCGSSMTCRAGSLYWYLETELPSAIVKYRVTDG